MNRLANLSNRAQFVSAILTIVSVVLAICAYFLSVSFFYLGKYGSVWALLNRDFCIVSLFIALYWSILETWLNLNEVYRSRSYGYVVLYHIVESFLGAAFLLFTIIVLGLPSFGRNVLILFGGLSFSFCLAVKVLFYAILKVYRKRGKNQTTVVFVCDTSGERMMMLLRTRLEWGYKIKAVVGDEYIVNKYKDELKVYPLATTNMEEVLTQDVDELIYACDFESLTELSELAELCSDLGVTFRLYSQYFNRVSANLHVRYFDTNAVLTVSTTPTSYMAMLAKRVFDIVFSAGVLLVGAPFMLIVALLVKLDSHGPIFFRQVRTGLKGKEFTVYKFRTMCADAEEQRKMLESQNEMSGPVFKITNDPRVTRVGRFLRKTGIDELPQFFNVLIGNMSIVGPRPPLPDEVRKYERWQLRRLAMKPGITCLWQVARDRNNISFEEWMRMDMNYIDNWSFSLDLVIVLQTVRAMFRADGK